MKKEMKLTEDNSVKSNDGLKNSSDMLCDRCEMYAENTDFASYLFHQGTNFASYDLMGCHYFYNKESGKYTYVFRVWAPHADKIEVIGDFCTWNCGIPMKKITGGIWEVSFETSDLLEGAFYKYAVTRGASRIEKSDPYAFASQTLGKTASVIKDISNLKFSDGKWLSKRHEKFHSSKKNLEGHFYPSPMNIYEVHAASWKTKDGECNSDGEHYLNYRELADELAPYAKSMGYTHVELLPVTEYPFDGSWGYQVTGYYAPTSRFGTPEDFAYFVNKFHKEGLGVILDWVPAHFPKDISGLYEFDGSPLYEYQGADRMENRGWGTRYFDVGREEVRSFLISNALFWFRKYHIDGLRVDAVASMLYLDYDREPGEWIPNINGDNKNLEAIDFFKKLNSAVFAEFPDVLMIAEESTSWPMITKPVDVGGLGFNFKWNMGFANDMFEYVQMDPIYRQYHHDKLTFPLMYAYNENYILPVSHDEVVHGKLSLYNKMFGTYDEKFSAMRTYLTYMMTMPGKKLLFMGCEFAQIREWDFENQLEWFMTDYPRHTEMQRFVKFLNGLYLKSSELWEIDDSWDGFKWIDADRTHDNAVIYERKNSNGKSLTVVINFSPLDREGYEFEVSGGNCYEVVLNSDLYKFGGRCVNPDEFYPVFREKYRKDGKTLTRRYLKFDLPAYTALILKKRNKRENRSIT